MEQKTLIGMLTFNSEMRIQSVLKSITTQENRNWELHIFDDYSTDKTRQILQEFTWDTRIVLHLNTYNRGFIANLNESFRFFSSIISNFDYFWFAQHDDYYSSDYLHTAIAAIETDSEIVGAQFQVTNWNCPESSHLLTVDDYLQNPSSLFHYNGKSSEDEQKHSIVGIVQGVVRAPFFSRLYGADSQLVGTLFSFELLLVLNILLQGQFALIHGNQYVVSTGETIETLYPNDSYNKNRRSIFKTIYHHYEIFKELCVYRHYPIRKRIILFRIILLNILHGERRFVSLKRLLRIFSKRRFTNIEREIRKIYRDRFEFFWVYENIRLILKKNLFFHRCRNYFFRSFNSKILTSLLKFKYRNPNSFNGKLRYKLFRDNREILKTFTDKIDSKKFIEETLGSEKLPKTYFSSSSELDLTLDGLPRECVIKASHLSGGALIISCDAPRGAQISDNVFGRTLIHPDDVTEVDLREFASRILSVDYDIGPFTGFGYMGLARRFIVEELVKNANLNERVYDIKVFVLNGVPRLIRKMSHADQGQEEKYVNDFLPDGTRLNSIFYEPGKIWEAGPVEFRVLPEYISEILKISEIIGQFTDFMRVDFLCNDESFFIGELTSFPTGTRGEWKPNKVAQYLNYFFSPWNEYSD